MVIQFWFRGVIGSSKSHPNMYACAHTCTQVYIFNWDRNQTGLWGRGASETLQDGVCWEERDFSSFFFFPLLKQDGLEED